jgi:hypothetical protein
MASNITTQPKQGRQVVSMSNLSILSCLCLVRFENCTVIDNYHLEYEYQGAVPFFHHTYSFLTSYITQIHTFRTGAIVSKMARMF